MFVHNDLSNPMQVGDEKMKRQKERLKRGAEVSSPSVRAMKRGISFCKGCGRDPGRGLNG